MEKAFVKTGIYSFIVSFSLFLVFMPREKKRTGEADMNYIEEIPYQDFFFDIVRYSLIISLIATGVVLFICLWKKVD